MLDLALVDVRSLPPLLQVTVSHTKWVPVVMSLEISVFGTGQEDLSLRSPSLQVPCRIVLSEVRDEPVTVKTLKHIQS